MNSLRTRFRHHVPRVGVPRNVTAYGERIRRRVTTPAPSQHPTSSIGAAGQADQTEQCGEYDGCQGTRTHGHRTACASCFQELSLLLLLGPSMALTDRSLVVREYRYKPKPNVTRVFTAVQVLYHAFHLRRQDISIAFWLSSTDILSCVPCRKPLLSLCSWPFNQFLQIVITLLQSHRFISFLLLPSNRQRNEQRWLSADKREYYQNCLVDM